MKIPKKVPRKRKAEKTSAKTATNKKPWSPRDNFGGVINEEWQDSETGGFKKGNPGRPKGSVNQRTKFMNMLMETFGEAEQKKFKEFFKNPNWKFLSALDRIVSVAAIGGKSNQVDPESLPPFQVIIEGQDAKAKT